MPVCKNPECRKQFPNRLEIDGKIRFLNQRKYCLECSPFGKHIAWRLDKGYITKRRNSRRTFCCKTCGNLKNVRSRNTECSKCRGKKRRDANREKAFIYKGGKCVICGYNKYHGAMDFHHLDSDEKEFVISTSWQCSWDKLRPELDKCVLLCKNCHAEVHGGKAKVPVMELADMRE